MRRASDRAHPAPLRSRSQGFTLIEMIIVIVISGILLTIVGMFGRRQIDAYVDVGNRVALAEAADTALRRIARELQSALPNSVRQTGNVVEFVPIRDAGRYRAAADPDFGGDVLESNTTDSSFDVLGPSVSIASGDWLFIDGAGSEIYGGDNRRSPTPGTALTKVTFVPAGALRLSFDSPRFHVIGTPVTYECAPNALDPAQGRLIRHWNYGFLATQPQIFGSGTNSSVLVDGVSDCSFGLHLEGRIIVLRLTLSRNGESVDLLHQVEVMNTP